jgi:hypothetical protein
MKIPHDVYEAINNSNEGFDKMYYNFIKEGLSQKNAFYAAQDRVNEFFPDYQRYSSYESYNISKNRRYRDMLQKNKV